MIVGGSANLAGKAALGLVRLNATNGAPDPTFGAVGANGQVATLDRHARVNGYITGMALTGNLLAVSGRASDPAGLATVAARYYAVGFPPPPPPLPAASTTGRRPDHLELGPRQRHGQRQRHREHLVDRVRHDDSPTARRRRHRRSRP